VGWVVEPEFHLLSAAVVEGDTKRIFASHHSWPRHACRPDAPDDEDGDVDLLPHVPGHPDQEHDCGHDQQQQRADAAAPVGARHAAAPAEEPLRNGVCGFAFSVAVGDAAQV